MQTEKPKRVREKPEEKLLRLTQLERGLWAQGLTIAGIDEVGRGPLAGPVVTACVSIPQDKLVPGVDDSKKLSEKKREQLYPLLLEAADYAETCFLPPELIDLCGRFFRHLSGGRRAGTAPARRNPVDHPRRRAELHDRRSVHCGQGRPRPLHDRAGQTISDVRFRTQQGLRYP